MNDNSEFYIKEMQNGKIFIFPTDTIYGIGCNAQNINSIKIVRKMKYRNKKPFAIIAPNYSWITGNCNTNKLFEEKYNAALNGKLTLITTLKKQLQKRDSSKQ